MSNFKGFSAYFARMSPLGVYTYAFGFHSGNLTPFWTVSQRVDRVIDTLRGDVIFTSPLYFYSVLLYASECRLVCCEKLFKLHVIEVFYELVIL